SQAGWIMPAAADGGAEIRFIVALSGPTVPTMLEDVYSRLMLDGQAPSPISIDYADRIVRSTPREGFDPGPAMPRVPIAPLWIFGALDTSIPVAECVRVLDRLRKGHDFDVVTLGGAGHMLYRVPADIERELIATPGMEPAMLSTLRTWLRAKVVERPPVPAD